MNYALAKSRYKSIKDRSFQTFVDLFLIRSYLEEPSLNTATLQAFESFDYDNSRMKECLAAYQLGSDAIEFDKKPVKELDKAITDWYNATDLKPFKSYFEIHRLINEQDFLTLYGHNDETRKCVYCGTNEDQISLLVKNKLIESKRL